MSDSNVPIRLLAISGSLRRDSINTGLLRALQQRVPDGVSIDLLSYGDVPLYNGDVDQAGVPDSVGAFKAAIAGADGLLIATPEYNYSVPGPLKNAIDWASRPGYKSVFVGKPVAVLGASPGPTGAVRALGHLKQILLSMLALVYPAPDMGVGQAGAQLSADGEVSDDALDRRLRRFVEEFATFTRRQKA